METRVETLGSGYPMDFYQSTTEQLSLLPVFESYGRFIDWVENLLLDKKTSKKKRTLNQSRFCVGGDKGTRTPDLFDANESLEPGKFLFRKAFGEGQPMQEVALVFNGRQRYGLSIDDRMFGWLGWP